jgi:hypothetical protein
MEETDKICFMAIVEDRHPWLWALLITKVGLTSDTESMNPFFPRKFPLNLCLFQSIKFPDPILCMLVLL